MSINCTELPLRASPTNVFTVDVEDWFHFDFGGFSAPMISWADRESRVSDVTERLLEILNAQQASATFFILGWIAEKYPALVRRIAENGHEIGCHTYSHHKVFDVSPTDFRNDLRKATALLEDASGMPVKSFRAPFFSINHKSEWAFEILAQEGFLYDSSIFPAQRLDGGMPSAPSLPFEIHTSKGDLYELPITTVGLFGKRATLFGGGYFRLLPVSLVSLAIKRLNDRGVPVNFYIHPHDLDVGQPRLELDRFSRFRRYVGIERTEKKLNRLLSAHRFGTVAQYFGQYAG